LKPLSVGGQATEVPVAFPPKGATVFLARRGWREGAARVFTAWDEYKQDGDRARISPLR